VIRTKSNEDIGEKQDFGLPGLFVPGEVLFNDDLSFMEKFLFGLIHNLSASENGCWASNHYLGKCLSVGVQSISNGISKLQKLQYITTEYSIRARDRKQMRRIWVNPTYSQIYRDIMQGVYKKINRPHIISLYGPPNKIIAPSKKIYPKYNIKNNNENNNNNKKINKKDFFMNKFSDLFSQDWMNNKSFKTALTDYIDHRLQKNSSSFTDAAIKKLATNLNKQTIQIAIEALDQSVANGWTGVFPSKGNNGSGKRKFEQTQESFTDPNNRTKYPNGTVITNNQ
jgi:hypothetical protein